jgi:mono/diheme cytochrome c family protein
MRRTCQNELWLRAEHETENLPMLEGPLVARLLLAGCWALAMLQPGTADAADAGQGKTIAERWCAACHRVERDPKSATDQPPPFVSFAGMPGFDANKLAFLLLRPHPNMPELRLSRAEVADLADYIETLK